MNEKILIIEDEQELCMTLGDRLRSEGYDVEFAFDGISGLEKVNQGTFDLIILDIMLPSRSGLDLCTDVRRAGSTIPILLLSARSQTVDKIIGLKLGADDYVTKPFDTLELTARIEALLRRNRTETTRANGPDLYHLGPIMMNIRKTQVSLNGDPVSLTQREFQLLRYFAEHQGIAISRDELLREVWGYETGTMTRTVDVHVASLRQKLEDLPQKPEMIITVPGLGYRFQI